MAAALRDRRTAVPDTDLMLDVTLWVQIALLAYVLSMWQLPVQDFPPLFLTASWHAVSP
jgi:hypothetical protein